MYIKTSSLNININPWIKKKIINHQRPYKKYWFHIVDDKKDLIIWSDSPFNVFKTLYKKLKDEKKIIFPASSEE
jgi:hypothetical protein